MAHYFDDQRDYEHVFLFSRRHWFVVAKIAIAYICFAAIPFLAYALISAFTSSETIYNIFLFLMAGYYLVWWYGLFYHLTDYILDTWIVTDHRIIDTEQLGLFRRNVAETNIRNVQDVTTEVSGLLETFLNYGTVYIQTAGPMREIVFKEIPNPEEVKKLILGAYTTYKRQHANGVEHHDIETP